MRGFAALAGGEGAWGASAPYYVGVQAQACAPVWHAFHAGMDRMAEAAEGSTVAEGVRVRQPARAQAILREMAESGGRIEAVGEADILPAYTALARAGVHVEPTAALVWAVLPRLLGNVPEPIILILSGAGLKYRPSNVM
jgi:threonine synthase